MPKIDVTCSEESNQTGYPPPYDEPMSKRYVRRLARALGIVDFGASYVTLLPGGWSSQRHWHSGEDELLVMLEGEATLIEDQGKIVLHPGEMAAWAKGVPNGHHLINESARPCRFLVIGRPPAGECFYPDIDLYFNGKNGTFSAKPGQQLVPMAEANYKTCDHYTAAVGRGTRILCQKCRAEWVMEVSGPRWKAPRKKRRPSRS